MSPRDGERVGEPVPKGLNSLEGGAP